ncbi:MAG TPA: acylphosphatase [Anaerolineales bacterium]|nr:acylphosphatase [Anaerolineales bacterium]
MPAEIVRVHVWVQGVVQNVGFRAHVELNARQLGVRGWVRNVGYDTVEAVAEGQRENADRFVESMKAGPRASRVNECRIEWEPATGEFRSFEVKRSL